MEIFMFIMFMSTNLFMILILKYSCDGNYHYNNGMILGVHIPSEHSGDEAVISLAQKEYKNFKCFLIINIILSTASCLLIFLNMIISLFVYIIWILGFCAAISILSVSSHRRMYSVKEKNGWIIESQKKKVFIDTRVSAEAGKSELSYRYHIAIIIAEIACFLPFISRRAYGYFETIAIFFVCSLLISAVSWLMHIYVNHNERTVYSENSELNRIVNRTVKCYKGASMLVLSASNAAAWIYAAIAVLISTRLTGTTVCVYILIELFAAFAFIPILIAGIRRKSELLSANPAPIYVDDDEYWKSGFYYNPDDPHMLVPNRLQSGNYAFNYANRGARIITAGLTVFIAASFIFTIAVLVPFVNVKVDIRTDNSRLHVDAAGYSSDIDMNSITDVQILNELPDDGFSKINGGATDTYLVGRFKGNTYGYCNLYIYTGHTPVLMVKTDGETVFFNSDVDGKLQEIYDELLHNMQSSSQSR